MKSLTWKNEVMEVLQQTIKHARNSYLLIIAASAILLPILVVYWQDLSILFNEALQSEAVSQIILIPALVSYLIYRKKGHVKTSLILERLQGSTNLASLSNIVGVAFCLTAFLLYWYGSYTFYPLEYHIVSLIVFVTGVTLILANIKTLMILIFPILFLAFLAPPPSIATYTAGALLANINTQGSYALLKTVGFPISLSTTYGAPIIALNTPTGLIEFGVYQASSGIYSVLAFAMFATFLAFISRGSITRKAALLVLGLLILPIFNILRISFIVAIAHWFGEQTAMTVFHAFTGWLIIIGEIFLLLFIGEKILHLEILAGSKKTSHCSECNNSLKKQEPFCLRCGKLLKTHNLKISKIFWVKILALLIGSGLVTASIQAPVFAFSPELTISNINPQGSLNVFPEIPNHELLFLYRDTNYERVTSQDSSLVYGYFAENQSALPVYVLVGVSSSLTNLHNWEVCLLTWQTSQGLPPLVTLLNSGELPLTENPRIVARYIVFQHPSNYTHIALYWYQKALFKTGLTVESKYVRINLLILSKNPKDAPQIIEKLQTIGQTIAAHWEPLRTQSLVSIGIPIQQFLLGSVVIATIFVQTSQRALEQRKKRINQKIFDKLASSKEKQLYHTIKKLSLETKETTTQNIASAFERATGQPAKLEELNDILHNLEESGIIKADITTIQYQPRLVWKP